MTKLATSSDLLKRLQSILLRQRVVLFVAGVALTAGAVLACALVLSLLANVMILPVWLKVTLMSVVGLAAVYLFGRYAVGRLFEGDVDRVAIRLEEKHPELKGGLVAAVEFARMRENTSGYSTDLIQANEKQALERAGLINFNEVLSFHPVLKGSRLLAVSAVLALLMLAVFPGFFSYSYEVYSNPTTEIAPPLAYTVRAVPGTTEWVKYRDLRIGAAVIGQRIPREAKIHYRLAGGNWQNEDIDLIGLERSAVDAGDSLQFAITLRQINKSVDYWVEAGRVKTDVQQIDVVDRPRVEGIKLSIFYPEYTGLSPTTIDENNGSFSAVVGSRVNMKIESNLPVEKAELVFADDSRLPLDVEGKTGEASIVVDESRSYHIRLTDHLGESNPDPIEYYVTAVPDEYPSIDVIRPGFDVNLNDQMMLPLQVRIFDDYGFSSLVLKYTVVSGGQPGEENVAVLHFSDRIKTEGDVDFNWDMDRLNLFPGDYVSYHFEVADNDRISGPKVSKSRTYIARLPSLDEIIAETEGQQKERIVETEDLLKSGKELSRRLENATRKLMSQNRDEQKADWEQKKELESIAKSNEEMLKNIEEMARKMDKTLDEMREDALMSRELMEKMQQLQKLFEEVATPEMREAQKKLMDALKNMDRNELQQAMKDFEMSQEEMMQRLERQLALLKKMQLEQKMEAMLRKAEELLERQDQMNNKAEESEDAQLPKLSDTQDEITKSLEDLKKEVAQLREMLNDPDLPKSPQGEKFADAIEKTDADANMKESSEAMDNSQKDKALSEGNKASNKLAQMLQEMQQQLASMKGDDAEKIKQAMKRAIEDANYLSRKQEELLKEAAAMAQRSQMLQDMAQRQQDLKSSCSGLQKSIAELGKASPFVAAELQGIVKDAADAMKEAIAQLDSRRSPQATSEQREAMVNLNKASIRMMESLDEQQQCQNGGQCSKPMAALEQLGKKQNQLNQQMPNMSEMPKPGDPQYEQFRKQLERIAGEQGSIRKSLEELEKEFGNSREVLGRLSDIAREMRDLEEALAEGEAGSDVRERQLRIYSRMLEASRSLQRRDFNEQRQATTAENNPTRVPPALPADLLNDRSQFEDKLRRYLGDNYPSQYEEQIKAYFRALMNAESRTQAAPESTPESGAAE